MHVRLTMSLVALLAIGEASAFQFDVSLWRGETTDVLVYESHLVGEPPPDIAIRKGTLATVKYAKSARSLQVMECRDRVVWNGTNSGPQVVEITAAKDAKPGTYTCGMLNICVVDRVLPPAKEWRYRLDLWQHPWAVARWHGVEPFSDAHYRAMRPLWELLASAGQKTLTCTLLERPWDHQCYDGYGSMIGRTRRDDGSWAFDYGCFDRYVEFGRSCGLGPDIACYSICPWGYVCRYRDERGKAFAIKCEPGTPEFDDYWGEFLVDFARHLGKKGWLKDTLIAMDERSPKDVRLIVDYIRRKAPGLRISMAGNFTPEELKEMAIESYCSVLSPERLTPEFLALVPERRKAGMVTTYYVCGVPAHPNTLMSCEPDEAFWVGAYPGISGLDGFLRWSWNSWPKDPMHDATFSIWASGDTFLAYPDGSPSWRFLELRNGIATAEKLRILKGQGLYGEEIAELSKSYGVEEAVAGRSDFNKIRWATVDVVNK